MECSIYSAPKGVSSHKSVDKINELHQIISKSSTNKDVPYKLDCHGVVHMCNNLLLRYGSCITPYPEVRERLNLSRKRRDLARV